MAETAGVASHEKELPKPEEDVVNGKPAIVDEHDDGANYPSPTSFALLMVGISAACFIVALDRTIVATAIPRITDEFNSPEDVGWYASAYLLVSSTLWGLGRLVLNSCK